MKIRTLFALTSVLLSLQAASAATPLGTALAKLAAQKLERAVTSSYH